MEEVIDLVELEKESPSSHNAIYLLRTVQQHHVQLSAMADHKAGVLLGASFVSLSILGAWSGGGAFAYAVLVMATAILFTALFSALVLIPRSNSSKGPSEDRNLMFFGTFAKMRYADFESEVLRLLNEDSDIFKTMIRDIYSMGVVQHRKKYFYLRLSYACFICGVILSPLVAIAEQLLPKFLP